MPKDINSDLIKVNQAQVDKLNNALLKSDNKKSGANIVPRRSIPTTSPQLHKGSNQSIYLDKNTRISFEMLNRLSYENSIVAAIINTRINQVANFSKVTHNKYQIGYRMKMLDEEEEPTEKDLTRMKEIEKWLSTCGDNRGRHFRDRLSFEDFLRAVVRDRLVNDNTSVELVPDMKGDIHHFLPVDGSSTRYINEYFDRKYIDAMRDTNTFNDYFKEEKLADGEYAYVQVYENRILQGFTHEQMIVKHANPVVKLGLNGYPIGELEQVINQITSFLFAETHTRLYFMQGFSSTGILHIKEDMPDDEVESFRQHFYAQLTGTQNSFRTPIMAGVEDVKWIDLGNKKRDMEWAKWLEFLTKVLTAIYLIDPSEINFDIVRGGGNTINEGNRNAILLQASRDKGLLPLLRFIENLVNEILFRKDPAITDRYAFEFTGIRTSDLMQDIERWKKQAETYKTINEIRRENDLPEVEYGDIIENSIYVTHVANEKNREVMAQTQGVEGEAQEEGNVVEEGTSTAEDEASESPENE